MGGKAFNQLLPPTAFPRIPPAVYHSLKARILPCIQELYTLVGVPFESPEKTDHGDIDLIVATATCDHGHDEPIPMDKVKKALGATVSIHLDGNRTSNFAVPVTKGEWTELGHALEEEQHRSANGDDMYYQVDVHVCVDAAEWDRIVFFHSYGDLGMILGLLARNNGLLLGSKGLKIPDPPNPPFELSVSFPAIIPFFGLSLATWEQGFKTKLQVFEWVATSRLFDPACFKIRGEGIRKVKEERKMYAEFTFWVESRLEAEGTAQDVTPRKNKAEILDEALVYFNKKEEFEELARSRSSRARLKEAFNGKQVNEWATMGSNWRGVKLIMDRVRMKLGGDEAVAKFVEDKGLEELRRFVLAVKDELGLEQGVDGMIKGLTRIDLTGDGD